MTQGSQSDRRTEERQPLALKVEYADSADLVDDYTENISKGGTFVLTQRELSSGTEVKLVLSFPGLIDPISLAGTVRWTRTAQEGDPGVGVEFAALPPELEALMGRIAAGDPSLVLRTLGILLVEDNPHVATLIRDGLLMGGRRELANRVQFHFTTAVNGREALDFLVGGLPCDLLITDVYLPVMDGVQLIREVRARAELAGTPIVSISAGGPSAREAALDAGADFFLDKPMRLADILATMRRLTGLL